jgi:hypothetical protein
MAVMNIEERQYRYYWLRGTLWLTTAQMLKRAADKILADQQAALKRNITMRESEHILVTDDRFISMWLDMQMLPVYMILTGYALEDLFKGIIICGTWLEDPSILSKDNFKDVRVPAKGSGQPMKIDKHGLRYLLGAEAMTLTFEEDEKAVMDDLDEYIMWAGRYPISKEYKPSHIQPGGIVYVGYGPFKVIDVIYEKSIKELERLNKLQGNDSREVNERPM